MQEDSKLKAKKDFDEIFGQIKKSREIKLKGGENSIKFPNLPMISKLTGGWVKGRYYCFSAASGVGKTIVTKAMTIFEVYDFIKSKPNSGLSAKIIWFGLEESYEKFRYSVISNRVYWHCNYFLDENKLLNNEDALTDAEILMIQSVEKEVSEILEMVEYHDSVHNPTGLFKTIRNYAVKVGKFYFEGKEVTPPDSNDWKDFHWSSYKENDEHHYVFAVIDNINILEGETGALTLFDAGKKLSDTYLNKIVGRKFNFIPIVVQQQALAGESLEHFKSDKLLPSKTNLGDNKTLSRDYHAGYGIFDPTRHEKTSMTTSVGVYDVSYAKLGDQKDCFRTINCWKNRNGKQDWIIAICYYGDVLVIKELPPSDRNSKMANGVFMSPEIYKQVQNKEY